MKIVVLNARALHLGYLGCYGCDWVATPSLDNLAAEGVVFDQHFADCPRHERLPLSAWTGRFQPPLTPESGHFENPLAAILTEASIPSLFADCLAWDQVGANVRSFVKKSKKTTHGFAWFDLPSLTPPWTFAEQYFAHYFPEDDEEEESLTPWPDPPTGPLPVDGWNLERLQNTYAAAVTFLDEKVGQVITALDSLREDLVLMVTADCGFALGEHGHVGEHRAWLHEELWHVPLIVRFRHGKDGGRRVGALTQPVDLFATVLEVLELTSSPSHGFSMLPLIRGESAAIRPYACAGLHIGETQEWALRTPNWLLLSPRVQRADDPPRLSQLFVKPDDRWEVNDVRNHHFEWAEVLEKTLCDFATAVQQAGPLAMPSLPSEAAIVGATEATAAT
jgi:arylsulfatase A-like enzyme